jgi:hypothetical protein
MGAGILFVFRVNYFFGIFWNVIVFVIVFVIGL